MKSNIVSITATTDNSALTALPTAKIVRHPRAKQIKEVEQTIIRPDEETLLRLNEMAKQPPFCIRHRSNIHSWLL